MQQDTTNIIAEPVADRIVKIMASNLQALAHRHQPHLHIATDMQEQPVTGFQRLLERHRPHKPQRPHASANA